MRHGCVSLGEVQCDDCHRFIPYPGRYLVVEETEDNVLHLCIDCSLKRGYAAYKHDNGELMILTFFSE